MDIKTPFARIISIKQFHSLSESDQKDCEPLKEYGENSVSIWAYSQKLKTTEPLPPVIGEETVEEAAIAKVGNRFDKYEYPQATETAYIDGFTEGAQWQSTRMYSDKWIDVKDRLPEVGVWVLGYCDNDNGSHYRNNCCVVKIHSMQHGIDWQYPNGSVKPPSKWMPLSFEPNVSAPTFTEQQVIELMEKMKEVAAEQMDMIYHDGHKKRDLPLKYFQSGADNLQPNKQSILSIDPKQLINDYGKEKNTKKR